MCGNDNNTHYIAKTCCITKYILKKKISLLDFNPHDHMHYLNE